MPSPYMPTDTELVRLASKPDIGGLTKAGRLLTKHANGKHPGSKAFPEAKGKPDDINLQAEGVLENILNDPLHFPRKHRTCGDWARRRERRFFDADR